MLARQAPGQQAVYLAAARVPDPHSPVPGPAMGNNASRAAGIPSQTAPDRPGPARLMPPVPHFGVFPRLMPNSSRFPGTGVSRAT